ncbi:hypothetical protein T492DRAFT_915399 [Pavlovales sp. CCMP2436]|nr:hypothetical protein T492DRAFT_915399 [Pavlovales sp. CCMP2436]
MPTGAHASAAVAAAAAADRAHAPEWTRWHVTHVAQGGRALVNAPPPCVPPPHIFPLRGLHVVGGDVLVLGHAPARNSARLCALILEDDFCPRVPQKRWTGAIEAALTCSTPKFRISGHTHRMLSLGALFRASTVRETHGLSRLMYDFVQRKSLHIQHPFERYKPFAHSLSIVPPLFVLESVLEFVQAHLASDCRETEIQAARHFHLARQ